MTLLRIPVVYKHPDCILAEMQSAHQAEKFGDGQLPPEQQFHSDYGWFTDSDDIFSTSLWITADCIKGVTGTYHPDFSKIFIVMGDYTETYTVPLSPTNLVQLLKELIHA